MAQLAECVAQAALDGFAAGAGGAGNFLKRHAAPSRHQEGLALRGRQFGKGTGDTVLQL